MGKAIVWVLVVVLLAGVGFLLYDGGYVTRWMDGHAATPGSQPPVAAPEPETPGAAHLPTAEPGHGTPRPTQADGWLGRMNLGGGMAIFGVAIVLGAIIKLLSKLLPTVIVHRSTKG